MLTRRHLIALSAAQAFAPNLFIREGRAQTPKAGFPTKPVRVIVPVAAGGPTDIVARMLADKLSTMWGQQVFIENKPGAGTNIGNEYVARSDADGYTVLFDTGSLAVNTSLYRSLSYDAIADFAPISLVTRVEYFMFVPNSSPAHSLKEFVDYANPVRATHDGIARHWQRAVPGRDAVPSDGRHEDDARALSRRLARFLGPHTGSRRLLFRQRHIAFVLAVGAGSRPGEHRTETKYGSPGCARPSPSMLPGYEVVSSQALFVPAKTPRETVRKISADTNTVLADPAIRDKLAETGYVAGGSSPEELGKLLRSEIARWSARHQVGRHQTRLIFRALSPADFANQF